MLNNKISIARSFAVMGILSIGITACGAESSGGNGAAEKQVKLGHSFQNLDNQYWADLLKFEEELARDAGVEIISTQADDNPAKQSEDIDNLIARNVDVLAIDAIDPNAIVPALDAAAAAGIPVIALIAEPAGGEFAVHYYLSSYEDGFDACTHIARELGGEGEMIMLTGPLDLPPAAERAEGCTDAIAEQPNIEMVSVYNTDYSLRDAEQKMTDALEVHGEVDAVFGGNDDVALGAIRAMEAAGQDPTEKVVIGVDGTKAALDAICDGKMRETFATFALAQAKDTIEFAKLLAEGKQIESKVAIEALPVSIDNLDEMAEKGGVSVEGKCAE